jgi:hypothetical protein
MQNSETIGIFKKIKITEMIKRIIAGRTIFIKAAGWNAKVSCFTEFASQCDENSAAIAIPALLHESNPANLSGKFRTISSVN